MKSSDESLKQSVARQREELAEIMERPLRAVAKACAADWGEREALDKVLERAFDSIPYCKFLYTLDSEGVQISDNISREGRMGEDFGRDRSGRPYMKQMTPGKEFILSEAYISLRGRRPSFTALQVVHNAEGALLGYVGTDFDLRDLPITRYYEEPKQWRQIKGDPAIRSGVFLQTRVESAMDRHIDDVMAVMEELMVDHGVFHGKLHFSSSRATIWLVDDPYNYRLLDIDMLTDPDICLVYPTRAYPEDAVVPKERVREVLDGLRELRFADDTLYLRAGSLNIFNGMVNLTFSCDGSHYLPWDEFLNREHAVWAGANTC